MITFFLAMALLIFGYFVYGKFVEKTFGVDVNRPTPAVVKADGVDYVPMSTLKVYLIQFLNIAGLGPIFGPIMGAVYGPWAFVWIVFGSIFAGGVHDYMSGMMSVRTSGKSIAEICGRYLGKISRYVMLFISIMLLLFVGVVFIVGPATLLANLTFDVGGSGIFEGTIFHDTTFWIAAIFVYYFISTVVPIDKVIGKIYPLFGVILMFMAFGIAIMMIYDGLPIPELTDITDYGYSSDIPVWPALFFTISCGALSGFHATQSPLMARTIKNEKLGRKVFYGAMISEAVLAMIWASVGMAFFPQGIDGLKEVLAQGGPGLVVNKAAVGYLGLVGGLLAIIGVVVAPITSGDTAFRSIRLTLSDHFNMPQVKIYNRLVLSVPVFIIAFLITQIGFQSIWMYFTFSNQLLATFVLWTAVTYLYKHERNFYVAAIPAVFMSASLVGYVLTASEFPLGLSYEIAIKSALVVAIVIIFFLIKLTVFNNKKMHSAKS